MPKQPQAPSLDLEMGPHEGKPNSTNNEGAWKRAWSPGQKYSPKDTLTAAWWDPEQRISRASPDC